MDHERITRRQLLHGAAAALALVEIARAQAPDAPHRGALRFKLNETAGLRRFGYPVHAILPGVSVATHFRLSRGDQVVPAQFLPIEGVDGRPAIALDFNASPAPLATETYTVSYGDDVDARPVPNQGMRVEPDEGVFRVSNGKILGFDVPRDLMGFLKAVRNAGREFLRGSSDGLWIRCKDDVHHRVGGKAPNDAARRASISRAGPIAVGLRFESTELIGGERSVSSVVTMTFPNSKSWVETTWTVADPQGWVAGLGVDLNLAIEGAPTLVDLGASDTVYGQIKGEERMELSAGQAPGLPAEGGMWTVRKGAAERLEPLALPPRVGAAPAQGWAHVMDRSRCTALALAGFGRSTRDQIVVDASGHVRLMRDFAGHGAAPPPGPKSLTCWFHFVDMPVQVGAATSPQAMFAPLQVVWEPGQG